MNGSYVIVFKVSSSEELDVGAIEGVELSLGEYGYVGSAEGNGGIESRVNRHIQTDSGETENTHWHIDYILDCDSVSISSVFYTEELSECEVRDSLLGERCRGFSSLGASDCSCESHIVRGDVTGSCLDLGLERF